MADGIVSMLLDRLASTVYEYVDGELKLVLDAKKDVEEFAGNLRAIQAVLEDAEQRQVKDASVRIWLDQLKDISLQMVDVLDEWNSDMLRQQVEKQEREGENAPVPEKKKKKKVTLSVSPSCFCFRKAKEVIFRRNIASKIKDLNDKLSVIDEQRERYGFQHIERGIQELPERQKTSSFVVVSECIVVCGEDENRAALHVGDLRVLNLEGSLIIKLKGNMKDERELEKAQSWHRKKLFRLEIDSMYVRYKQTSSTVEILNALRPHENLESLYIRYYSGTTCPNWIMSLHNLRIIFLRQWSECKFLPPLGKLPNLEQLIIMSMEKVEKIGGEFLGLVDSDETSLTSSSSSFFPKLKELTISFTNALKEWEVGVEGWNKEDSEISIMPCLSSLEISYCKCIKTLPDFLCKTPLQDLIISRCPILSERCKQDSGTEWPKISHIPNIKISSD